MSPLSYFDVSRLSRLILLRSSLYSHDLLHRVMASILSVHPRVRPRRLAAGGDDGIRTHDPLLAGQVLSQLSYTPISGFPVTEN